ncbi:hypothetical protein B0H16DRAFT_1761118 [Mycena metata]|uniref:Beta-glucuronidase C-terminal domain-containing protein n=1 Tax=Mycena metata TaxID=1033252 RepID=A0AAD7IAK6_9AGAR|nr:hypothetical protein B0H16DRAFT_1761118 [Mycena metata]
MSAISAPRTGAPVHIRVGGTSMDNIIFNASETIGSPWLSALKNFNPNTRFTLQVPLARNFPVDRLDFARACIDALPNGTQQLDALEIGNEPDLYPVAPTRPCASSPDRPKGYGPEDYVSEWKAAAKNLTEGVDALNGQNTWYQALTFSTGVVQNIWNVQALWNDSVDQGEFVKTVSQHYGSLEGDLMNHSKIISDMHSSFGPAISFLQPRGVPFILGEVGTAVGSGCTPPSPLKLYRSLGAALWTADFMLNAMSMGIQRVSMMQGTNFSFSAWQPVTTAAEPKGVHGNWYGHVFAADFIGTGGDFQIYPLPINDTHPHIVSYAGYNSGLLTKLAVLNMRFWNGTNDRPAVNIELAGLASGITGARVSRLTAPGGSAQLLNISWAGKQWSAGDDGQEPKGNNSVVVNVVNGSLAQNVTAFASQALMLEMIRV